MKYVLEEIKKYKNIILMSIFFSICISLALFFKIGIKNIAILFVTSTILIINIYMVFIDKIKSIIMFIVLFPIYTTVRRLCYFDVFFIRVTFETIYVTVLFIHSFKDIKNKIIDIYRDNEVSFKFLLLLIAFLVFSINSSFYSNNIMRSLSEVYIGVLVPIMFYLVFVTYFNRDLKYKVYYALFIALDFSCIYGVLQVLLRMIKTGQLKIDRLYLTFGYHNVNIFAGILMTIIPLILELILYRKNSRNENIFLILSFLLYAFSTMITFSRGAWLCFMAAIAISLISKKYWKILALGALGLSFFIKPLLGFIITRGTTTSFLQNESAVARLQSIFTDLTIIKKFPFGIGGGSFAEFFKEYALQGYLNMPENIRFNSTAAHYALEHAHNLLLQVCVEFGVVSTILFLLVILNRLRLSFKNFKFNRGAFNAVIIYFIFSLITGNEFNHKGVITGTLILYILFGIIELSLKGE